MKLPESAGVVSISLCLDVIVTLLEHDHDHHYAYETLQDQILWRDVCFVVEASNDFSAVLAAIKKVPEVKDVEVFDVYAGKNLGDGKKSIACKIKLLGDGNMTTEQINEVMDKVIKAGEKAGGILRA
jgi:phenylalanyl-tRNA synthetase beta subunit